MIAPLRLTCLAVLLMSVCACKSGGGGSVSTGGGGNSGTNTDPVVGAGLSILEQNGITAQRIIALARNNPQANSQAIRAVEALTEYARNPALVASNLSNKIALGLTGRGVVVGVVDSGIDWSNANLAGVSRGGDLIALSNGQPGDAQTAGGLRHATAVAQIIAGTPGDGDHARGVAPGVTLHNLAFVAERSEIPESISTVKLGQMMDYAVNNRLDLVNMSISIPYDQTRYSAKTAAEQWLNPTLRTKMLAAVRAGTVFVIANGNSGLAETDNALIGFGQIDGLMNGQIVAVSALNQAGTGLASFSNACGSAMNYCISAVGVNIPVENASGQIVGFSGTSAATPVVTGAMALLLEQFPELGAAEMVELTFATTDDLGDAGIDAVYGRGRLNMNRALAPVGNLMIATGETTEFKHSIAESILVANGSTAGLAAALRPASVTLIDDFDRGFQVGADNFVMVRDEPAAPIRDFVLDLDLDADTRIRVTSDGGMLYSNARLSFGYISPEAVFGGDSALLDHGYSPSYAMNESAVLGLRIGKNDILFAGSEDASNLMLQFGHDFSTKTMRLRAELGLMHEDKGLLGAELTAGRSQSAWLSFSAEHEFLSGLNLSGSVTGAKTWARDGEFVLERADLNAGSARIGLSAPVGTGRLGFSIGTPLVADSGTIRSDLPVDRDAATDGGTSTGVLREKVTNRIGSGRPVDLGLSWTARLADRAELTVKAARRVDDRNGITAHDDWIGVHFSMRF